MSKRQSPCLSCVLILLLVSALFSGCGSSHSTSTLSIALDTAALMPGSTTQLHATITDSSKHATDVTSMVNWTSSSPAVATVSPTGLLTGASAGTSTVAASLNGMSATHLVGIGHGPIQGLSITPTSLSLALGGTEQLAVTATYADRTTGNVTGSVRWAVAPAGVATISTNGLLTATAAGPFALTANLDAESTALLGTVADATSTGSPALSSLAITPAGASIVSGSTQQFTATATLADGTTADVSSQANWLSSNTAALVINSTGLATASGASDAAVVVAATYGSASTLTTVQVKAAAATTTTTTAATLTALYVQPTSSSIVKGSAEQHTALAFYSDGSQQDVTKQVTWGVVSSATPATQAKLRAGLLRAQAVTPQAASAASTAADGVISVDSAGIETALATGQSQVQATLGSMKGTSVVLVDDDAIASLNIRASRDRFPVGGVQQVQLIGTAPDGHQQDLSLTANWQSSDPSVATISSTGLATGVAAGDVTFTASFGGLTVSTVGYQVLPKTLLSLLIDAPYTGLPTGGTEQLAVQGTYSDGTTHDLTALATWASLNPALISVTSGGRIFVNGAGTAQITATVGGLQALVAVVGNVDPVTSVDLLPYRPRFALGTTLKLTALSHFSSGAQVDTADEAIWTSLDPTVATVNATGILKSESVGKTTVTARAFGVLTTNPNVEVTNATLVRLVLRAQTNQLAAGTPQKYTALGVFSDGSFQDITADVAWSTTDFTKASIDATGLARAMRPAAVQVIATFQNVTASLPLTITDATVTSVAITPGNSELPAYVARQYHLIATFSDGTTQDLTQFSAWSAGVPFIASTLLKGEVLAINPGVGEITAQYGFFSASTQVNVTDATLTSMVVTPASTTMRLGQRQPMTVTGTFSDGYTQDMYLNVRLRSADPDVASVLDAHNMANATGIGSTQITGTYRGITATTTKFQVTSNVLQSIAFNPSAPTVSSGSTTQLTANGTFDDGVVYDLSKEVTWTSSNPAALTIDNTGKATAATVGVATDVVVTVTFGSSTSSFHVAILPPAGTGTGSGSGGGSGTGTGTGTGTTTTAPALTGIVVVPTSAHLAAGTQVQLTVLGNYTDGIRRDVSATSTWFSGTPSVATVDGSGLVTSVVPGIAQVTAQVGTFTATSTINVSSASLVSLALQTGSTPLVAGLSQPFALIGTFSDGSQQNLSGSAHWVSSTNAVATVSPTGVVTGVSAGSVRITASFNGQTATSATLAVGAAQPASLAITPATVSFASGTMQMFHAIATYTDGSTQDVTASASFTSSNPGVLRLDGGGGATGVRTGSAQLTVTFSGLSASTQTVTVTPATLVSLAVTPPNPRFALGTTQQFTVIGTFTDGSTQNLSTEAVWTSSNPAVLTVDGNGLATSASTGSAQITATLQGVIATTGSVQVTPATLVSVTLMPTHPTVAMGTDVAVTVVGHFSDGTTQDLTSSATFASSDTSVLTAGSNGVLHGVGTGSATLTLTVNGMTQTTPITVTDAVLVSIALTPANPVPFAKGTSEQFTVTGTFSDGTTQDLSSSAVWASSDTTVVTVNGHGLALGTRVGSASLSATYGGQTVTSGSVQVTPATATALSLSPPHATIMAGTTQQFTATVTNSDGTMQDVTNTTTWMSTDTAVATVNNTGLGTGIRAGNSTVAARYNGVSSTASLAVAPAAVTVQSVAVSPSSSSIAAGATQQMHATATNSDGTTQDVTGTVIWTSSNTAVAMVSTSGLVTATGAGSTTLTATGNGVSGTANLTVTATPAPVTLQSIAVTPTGSSIAPGATLQFHATGTYSDGSTQDLTGTAAWASSSTAVATVNTTGLATANGAGSSNIVAQANGVSGTSTLTVTTPANAPPTLQSIAVTPSSGSLNAGATLQLHATGTYSDGSTQDLTATVTWTSSSTAVATVNTAGLVTGNAAGTTAIVAQANGVSGTSMLTVTAASQSPTTATLHSIAVTPSNASIAAGSTQQMQATGSYTDGTTQDLTSSVIWSSSNTAVATINAAGLTSGTAAGTTSITAQQNGVSGAANLTVTAATPPPATLQTITVTPASASINAGATLQFHATGHFSDGITQDLTNALNWTSSNPGVATVNAAGLATATGAGSATITGTGNGASATANLTVIPATLQSITVTPASASSAYGATQQFHATGHFSDGTTQDLTSTLNWTSSNAGVATVNAAGLATATGAGSATITGTGNGASATANLTVTAATLQFITVTPASASLAYGAAQQFHATGTYADGTTHDLTTTVTWTSATASVASIDANGLAQAHSTGNTAVSATSAGVSGSASLTVGSAPLVSLTLTPANASIAAGTAQQYTAMGQWADGSTQDVSNTVAWTSSSTSVATVNATGLASAQAQGNTSIGAALGGVSASTTLTVTAAVAVHLEVQPASVSVAVGGVQHLTVVANFSDGTSQNVSGSALYTSLNPGVVTVAPDGTLRGVGTGSATVTITLNGTTTTLNATVTPATLTGITLTPATVNLAAGMSQQFTATATFSDGSTQDLTDTLTWATSAPSVATVNPTGNVIVLQAGQVTLSATAPNGIVGSLSLATTNAVVTSLAVTPGTASLAAGRSQQFAATATLTDGSQQDVTASVHWSVSGATSATVSNTAGSSGLLSTTAAGNVLVVATSGTVSAQAGVTVSAAQLASVAVSPASLSMPAGTTAALTVTGTYTDGTTASLTGTATYTVDNAWFATVDNTGTVHAMAAGSTTVRATAQGISGTVALTVTPATLSSIALTPLSASVAAGLSLPLTATGTYGDGSTANLTAQVQWTSSNATVGTVSATGSFRALRTGTTTVTAALNGTSQTVAVHVTAATLQGIAVQSTATTIAAGLSVPLSAVGTYTDGSTQNLTSAVTWSSQTPSIGLVSSTGVAIGLRVGSFTATATLNGVQGSASLTVTAPVLQSITLSPANKTVLNLVSQAFQYTATGAYSDGSTQNITNSVHWSILSGIAVGSISQAGRFTPLGVGTGTVGATSGAVTGTTHFTVASVL